MMTILIISVGILLFEVYYIGHELIKIRRTESDIKIIKELKTRVTHLEDLLNASKAEKVSAQNEVDGINFLWGKTIKENTQLRFDLNVAEKQLQYLAQKALGNQTESPKQFWEGQNVKLREDVHFL